MSSGRIGVQIVTLPILPLNPSLAFEWKQNNNKKNISLLFPYHAAFKHTNSISNNKCGAFYFLKTYQNTKFKLVK